MAHTYEHGGNILALARQLGLSPHQTADFSASINPLGMSSVVRQAICQSLDFLVHYPDTGCQQLKESLAHCHHLSPSQIAVANGSTEIIYRLPAMLPGRRALIVAPAFSEYGRALEQHRWEVQHLILPPQDNFRLDPGALEQALADGYDALYLCNPGNPSGTLYAADLIREVYDRCRAAGTFLVLDEAFMDFCEEHSAKQAIVAERHGLVLRSMTKFYAIPGLRLGYALGHAELIARLERQGGPWGVNTLAQAAGVAALEERDYRLRSQEYVRQERQFLVDQLSRFRHLSVYPSSVNFLLVEISGGLTAPELQERLLARGILIRDCSNFVGLDGRFFRIAVRTTEENRRLLACLEELFVD